MVTLANPVWQLAQANTNKGKSLRCVTPKALSKTEDIFHSGYAMRQNFSKVLFIMW